MKQKRYYTQKLENDEQSMAKVKTDVQNYMEMLKKREDAKNRIRKEFWIVNKNDFFASNQKILTPIARAYSKVKAKALRDEKHTGDIVIYCEYKQWDKREIIAQKVEFL